MKKRNKNISKQTIDHISEKITFQGLLNRIAEIFKHARSKALREINKAQVLAYWEIGREIVEFEQKGKTRAEYGEKLLVKISKSLSAKFGRGFSAENLRLMRKFYITYQKSKTLSWKSGNEKSKTPSAKFEPHLSWSHYCELLKVGEPLARSFYEQEATQNNWSVREMKRQINSMLFERLALSKDTRDVMQMAKKGQINRILKCFVLIDLKTGELDHSDIGQMNFYLNYFKENEKREDENDPIGLILCAKRDDIFAKYVLGGLNNKIFASKYKLALPSEREIKQKLKSISFSVDIRHKYD